MGFRRSSEVLEGFLKKHQGPGRVLIPGCGSGYEIEAFSSAGWDVIGIDFNAVAVTRARKLLGPLGDRVREGDFLNIRWLKEGLTSSMSARFSARCRRILDLAMCDGLPSLLFPREFFVASSFLGLKMNLLLFRLLNTNCKSCSGATSKWSKTRK